MLTKNLKCSELCQLNSLAIRKGRANLSTSCYNGGGKTDRQNSRVVRAKAQPTATTQSQLLVSHCPYSSTWLLAMASSPVFSQDKQADDLLSMTLFTASKSAMSVVFYCWVQVCCILLLIT